MLQPTLAKQAGDIRSLWVSRAMRTSEATNLKRRRVAGSEMMLSSKGSGRLVDQPDVKQSGAVGAVNFKTRSASSRRFPIQSMALSSSKTG